MKSIEMKMKIDYLYALYFLIVLPFLFPAYFSEAGRLKLVEYVITYLSLGLMVLEITRGKNLQFSYFPYIILFAEYAILLYSTYFQQGLFGTTFNTSIKKMLLFYVVGKALLDERKAVCLMRVVRDICIVIFLANFVTELIYPTGIPSTTPSAETPHFFLGNINSVVRAVFPGVCCSILLAEKKKRKLSVSTILFYIGFLYQFIFIYHSATTLVALTLILVWVLCSGIIKKHLWTIYAAVIGVVAYVQINLVVMSSSPKLLNFLSNLFHKTLTFSGRVFIWQRTLEHIYKNPLWGYGIQKAEVLDAAIGNQFSSHNYFLDITYQRGIIGLILFIILLAAPLILLRKNDKVSTASYCLLGFQSSILVMSLFEPLYSSEARMLPILCCLLLLLVRDKRYPRDLDLIHDIKIQNVEIQKT